MSTRGRDRVVVLSPHLDDAALSCWSDLASPDDVAVVNVFAGLPEPGVTGQWDRVVGFSSGRALMERRLAEDRAALAAVGREPLNLDLTESQYRARPAADSDVADRLEAATVGATALVAPAGIGGHEDHVAVRDAAIAIARSRRLTLRLYADFPYAVAFGWPAWVSGLPDDPRLRVDEYWDVFLRDVSRDWRGFSVAVRELSASERRRKLAALRAYETQYSFLNGGPLRRLERREIVGYEVLWELPA